MVSVYILKKAIQFLVVISSLLVSVMAFSQNCSWSGKGQGTIEPLNKCAPYDVEYNVWYAGLDASNDNKIQINWGEGPTTMHTLVDTGSKFEIDLTHQYPVGPKPCNYGISVKLIVNGESCDGSEQSQTIVVWDTDDVLGPVPLVVVPEEHKVCAGNEVTVSFADQTTFDCIDPTDPKNLGRWIQWEYGTTNSISGDVKINGSNQIFPFKNAPTYYDRLVLMSNEITLPITIPKTSQAGEVFELTLNNWNSCNPYDTDGNPANDPENAAVTKTVQIIIIDAPAGDFVINPNPVCIGNQVTYTNASTSGLQYEWRFNDGTISTAYNPPNKTYSTLGTFKDTLVVTDNLITGNTGTCFTEVVRDIEIIEQPVASFTISPAGEICEKTAVALSNNSLHTPAGTTWKWEIRKNSSSGQLVDVNGNNIMGYASTSPNIVTGLAGSSAAITYYVRLLSETPSNCSHTSGWQTIKVKANVGNPSFVGPSTLRCQGPGTTQYDAMANFATNFLWELSPVAAGSIDATGLVTWNAAFSGTANVKVTAQGCGPARSNDVDVSITPIVGNPDPISGLAILCQSGGNTNYSTSAANASSYTWSISGLGNSITGTGSTATVSWDPAFSGTATITVKANGCNGESSPANLDVVVKPVPVLSNPSADYSKIICSGELAEFIPTAALSGASFKWTSTIDPNITGVTDIGTNQSIGTDKISDILNNSNDITETVTYHITPYKNGCDGTTRDFVVSVSPDKPEDAGVIAGTNLLCEKESGIIFDVPSIKNANDYQWSIPAGATITAGANSREITVDFTGTVAGNYVVEVYGENSCGTGGIAAFPVEIKPTPALTANAPSSAICTEDEALINLSSVPVANYSWRVISKGSNISGSSDANNQSVIEIRQQLFNTGTTAQDITYSINPILDGCKGSNQDVTITVNPSPVVVINPVSTLICSGQTTDIALTSGTPGATFSWSATESSPMGATGGTGNSINQTLTNTTLVDQTVTYIITPSANSCSGSNESITITVKPSSDLTVAAVSDLICSNEETDITLSSGVAGTTFSWTTTVSNPGLTGAVGGNANEIKQILINSTSTDQTVTYHIITAANGCTGASEDKVITVKPQPVLSATVADNQICSGTDTDISIASNVTGTTISWTFTSSDPSVSGASNGSGTNILQTLLNSGNTIQTVTYHVAAQANGCAGDMLNVGITIFPIPELTITTTENAICNGQKTDVVFSSSVASTSFNWIAQTSDPAITGASDGSGNKIRQALSNSSINNEQVTYKVTPRANGCDGNQKETIIAVKPSTSSAEAGLDDAACGLDYNLSATTPDVGTGKWEKANGPGSVIFSDVNDPNAQATVSAVGTYIFSWTVSNGTCETNLDYVEVDFKNGPATSDITGPAEVCVNSSNILYQVSYNAGSTYDWKIEPALNAPAVKFGGGANDFLIALDFGSNEWIGELIMTETNDGCTGQPKKLAITSYPLPIADAGVDKLACQGVPVEIGGSPAASGGSGTYNYAWFPSSDLSDAYASNPEATLNLDKVYNLRVTDMVTGCVSLDDAVTVTVKETLIPGTINSDQSICEGTQPAPFTQIPASGDNGTYSYRWQKSSAEFGPFVDIPGASFASFSETTVLNATAYYRRMVAGGLCGEKPSNTLKIEVQEPIEPGTIGTDQTILTGSTPALLTNESSAVATGGITIQYQWQQATEPAVIYSSISGATGASYQPGTISNKTYFRRRASGGACNPVYSNIVTVDVEPLSLPGKIGIDQIICANSIPSRIFEVEAATGVSGSEVYQWWSSENGIDFTIIPGETGKEYAPTTALLNTTYFRRDFKSGMVGSWVSSNVIMVTVQSAIDPGIINGDQIICEAGDPSLLGSSQSPAGGSGSYTYQWKKSSTSAGGFTNIIGATEETYNPPAGLATTTYFRRQVAGGTCPVQLSNVVEVQVEPTLTGGTVLANQKVCFDGIPATFTNVDIPEGGNGSYNYQWQQKIGSGTFVDINLANNIDYSVTSPMNYTTTYRRMVSAGVCPQALSNELTVTVQPSLIPGVIAGDQTVCYNADPGLILSITSPLGGAGNGSYQYQWKYSHDNINFYDISGANSASYDPPAGITQTTYYVREVRSGVCDAELSNVVVKTVQETLMAGEINGETTICRGSQPGILENVTLASGGDGTYNYQWQWSSTPGGPYADISGAYNDAYQPVDPTSTTYFVRKVTAGVCPPQITNEIKVTVNQLIDPGTIGGEQTICLGTTPSAFGQVTASGGNGIYQYQWEYALDASGPFQAITGANSAAYEVTGPMSQTTFYRRHVSAGVCDAKYTDIIKVTVDKPVDPGTVGADQVIPTATVPALFTEFNPASGGNGFVYQYQWQAASDPSDPFNDVYGATQQDFQAGAVFMTTYFRRIVRSGVCPPESTNLIRVIAEEKPDGGIIGIGSHQHICEGEIPGKFEEKAGASGGDGVTYHYQWQSSTSQYTGYTDIAGETDAEFIPATPLLETTYFRRQVISGVNPPSYSNVVRVTVDPTPYAGKVGFDQVVCENGKPALFLEQEEAKGALVEYQWKASDTQGGPYSDIFLATGKLYQAPALTETTYYVREINSGVCGFRISNEIEVQVEPTLMSGLISGAQTICEGTAATPLAGEAATGGTGSYAYQWKQADKPGGPYLDIANADLTGYDITNTLNNTTYFRRMVTSVGGVCPSVLSNEVSVVVEPALQPGQIGGTDRICQGSNTQPFADITSPSGGNKIYEYQWLSSEQSGGPYEVITGATSQTYKAPDGLQNLTYYVRQVKSGQCQAELSNEVHIKVDPSLYPGVIAFDQTIQLAGDPVPFIATDPVLGGGDTYSFQWQQSDLINGLYEDIPSATSLDYDVPPGLLQTTYYRRKVTSGVCGSEVTSPVTVTVITDLTAGVIGNDVVVCFGNVPDPIVELSKPTGGTGIYTYQWKSSTSKSGPYVEIDGATLKNYTFTNEIFETTYYIREVRSGIFPPEVSEPVSVIVLPKLTPGSIETADNGEICMGDQPLQILELSAPGGGTMSYQYQWQSSDDPDGPFENIPLAKEAIYQPSDEMSQDTRYYIRKVVSGTCKAVYSNVERITVNPLPVVSLTSSAQDNTICSGDEVTFTAAGATLYEFFLKDQPFTESLSNNLYVTDSLLNGDFVYALGTDANGCQDFSNQIASKVNQLPKATITDTANICLGDQINLDLEMTGKAPFEVLYTDGVQEHRMQDLFYSNVITVQPSRSTTYSLISVQDGNGCYFEIPDQKAGVNVDSAVAKFSVSSLSGCSPQVLEFTNQDVQAGVTYLWSWGDGTKNNQTTLAHSPEISHTFDNHSFYNNAVFQVRLTAVTDAFGCSSTATQPVTIYPSMELDVEIDKKLGCAPLPVSFINNSRGVDNHHWYYRVKGSNKILEQSDVRYASFVLPNKTTETLIYELVYEAGTDHCTASSKVFEVSVYPELNAKFNVVSDTLIYPNTTVCIENKSNSGDWSYNWDFGDNQQVVARKQPEDYSYKTFGSYEISLKLEHGICKSEYKQMIFIDPGEPVIDFETNVIAGCRPLRINFENLSKYAETESFQWDFGDNSGTSAQINPEYVFTEPGHYFVTLTGSNSVGITRTKKLRIDVYDIPLADFNIRPNQVKIPDEPIYLTNLSWGADKYHWDFGDGNTSEAFEPVHYYQTAGEFDLLLVAENAEGCVDSMMISGGTLAIDGDRLKIPNVFTPSLTGSNGGRYLQFDHSNDVFLPLARGVEEFHLRVFNKWGEQLFESHDKEIGWDGYYNNEICPQDIYVYKLKIKFTNGKQIEQIGDITLLK
ncbi:MAG: PKD-like domain-containing protein [Candidatus Cyclobacteriaceae bacterium M3_2C_046]